MGDHRTERTTVATRAVTPGQRAVLVAVAVVLGLALLLASPAAPPAFADDAVAVVAVEEADGEEAAEGGNGSGTIVLGLLGAVVLMGIAFARVSAQD